MADDASSLTTAVDTAWSVHRATHSKVDDADGRRCLLERYLHMRREAHGSEVEELTGFGIAYLARLHDQECYGGWRRSCAGWLLRAPDPIGPDGHLAREFRCCRDLAAFRIRVAG